MRKVIWVVILVVLILTGAFDVTYGNSDQRLKVTNEMIYQKLIEVERRVVEIEKKQAVFEERFKQIDRRFEDMNKRFDQLYTFLWIITGIFTTIMVVVIGFAYWDRRTMIREAKRQIYDDMERELKPEKFRKVLSALRELAKNDKRVEEILRKEGLL